MSYRSFMWTSGLTHGGPYAHGDWANKHKASLGYSLSDANRGVMLGYGDDLAITASAPAGKSVDIATGAAIVGGYIFECTASETLTIGDNTSGYLRVDRVVLRADYTLGKVEPAIIAGPEDGSGDPAALVRNASYFDIPVARVAVASGFTSIADTDIEPDHYYANLPPVLAPQFANVSGGALGIGAVVVQSTGSDTAVTTTTTARAGGVLGVFAERTAHNASGKVVTHGPAMLDLNAAATRGQHVVASTTAGKGAPADGRSPYSFALVMESTTGAGLCLCWVYGQSAPRKTFVANFPYKASSRASTSYGALSPSMTLDVNCDDFDHAMTFAVFYTLRNQSTVAYTAYVRIYDVTDGAAIAGSEYSFSMGGAGGTTVNGSQSITLPASGHHQLRIEVKTSTGSDMIVDSAQIQGCVS